MKQLLAIVLLTILVIVPAMAEIKGTEVSYTEGGTTFKGYIATDTAKKGKRPGILVVHEWWGNNDYPRKRARMLAELGYTALAIDMYGEGKVAKHPKEAGQFSSAVFQNMPASKARFLAAMKLLKSQPSVDNHKIAAIGYCFGGGVVLAMARMGVDMDGVASFHGSLKTPSPAHKGDVKAKILVLNGADDPFTKPEDISNFKQEMSNAGVDFKLVNYPGAKHAFTNPEADINAQKFNIPALQYNEAADRESWAEMQTFFKTLFK